MTDGDASGSSVNVCDADSGGVDRFACPYLAESDLWLLLPLDWVVALLLDALACSDAAEPVEVLLFVGPRT